MDTIAAIATGAAATAIGIVRLSGDDAIAIVDKVFRPKFIKSMLTADSRKLYYGELLGRDGAVIDICMCTVSRAPHSYTGEDTAELQCHGSPTVLNEALLSIFAQGAHQAAAGEFTKRAFLNGRMDLTQAEAVIDLIDAETTAAAKNAAEHLNRAISIKTDGIYDRLCDIMAHFHAVLDYPDEDIEDFEAENYSLELEDCRRALYELYATYERGKILKDGVSCAIIGKPNVGKSSLLNALLGYDRAIVTDIAGTTRDTIEERVKIGGVILRMADTAGMRETEDAVEKIGVVRAKQAAESAELLIAVFDGSEPMTEEDEAILHIAKSAPRAIFVLSKCDLGVRGDTCDKLKNGGIDFIEISSKCGSGLDKLSAEIEEMYPAGQTGGAALVTNLRQAEALERSCKSLEDTERALRAGLTPDIVLTGVEQAMEYLGEISGKTIREDITARIFERFCVGK